MKNYMKRALAFMLALIIMVGVMPGRARAEEMITICPANGTWEINRTYDYSNLTSYQLRVFRQAIKPVAAGSSWKYTPIAVIGQQVVAGMNYAYLVRVTTKTKTVLKVMVITDRSMIDEKPRVISMTRMWIKHLKYRPFDIPKKIYYNDGGWQINPQLKSVELPHHLERKLQQAAKKSELSLRPVALLGKRIGASGKDYRILCVNSSMIVGTKDKYEALTVVKLHVDNNGKATISRIRELDMAAYIAGENTIYTK